MLIVVLTDPTLSKNCSVVGVGKEKNMLRRIFVELLLTVNMI